MPTSETSARVVKKGGPCLTSRRVASGVLVVFLLVVTWQGGCDSAAPANQGSNSSANSNSSSDDKKTISAAIVTVVVTGAVTLIITVATAFLQASQKRRDDERMHWDQVRLKYLNPLRAAATELQGWLPLILSKIDDSNKPLEKWFGIVKDVTESKGDPDYKNGFAAHCNGELNFAVGALYLTAVYLAFARRVRVELPYIDFGNRTESGGVDDQILLNHLGNVRAALGGEYGLWETAQESIGAEVTKPDGNIFTYREFCEMLVNPGRAVWMLRMIDFYREIAAKRATVEKVHDAMEKLLNVLRELSERRV